MTARKILLFAVALLTLILCLAVGTGYYLLQNVRGGLSQPTLVISEQPSEPTIARADETRTATIPTLAATSTPPVSNSTLDQLLSIDIPRNDPLQLVTRLKKNSGALPTALAPTAYRVGDRLSFWVTRDITGTYELITATLRYATPHAYLWLENSSLVGGGAGVSDQGLKSAGDTFENKIYPTNRKFLGSEPNPGVDGDPHVFILNTHFNGGVIGYFSSADEFPTYVNRYSNQHEMIYLNLPAIRPGTEGYASTLAHEFAHMIHWNQNKREGSWITEGFGDLAIQLNGYSTGHVSSFTENPDLQLNAWAATSASVPHYGAAYLFLSYALNRFGAEFLHDLIASSTHDIFSMQRALDKDASGLKFDDVFADWVVANFINEHSLGARYSYLNEPLSIRPTLGYTKYPANGDDEVHQFGTDYIQFETGGRNLTFTFDGATEVKAIPTSAHSGKKMWWSNRSDQSDTTLTREFDLSSVKDATLNFWTWYDTEADFDYAYIEVSTDGGKTWDTLPGQTTTTRDPNGANYGNGFTCKSGSGCSEQAPPAQWLQESMSLTPYAGKKILLRFEYVTDAIFTGPGFAVDDISIPELNFSDDAEQSDNDWQAQGFARFDNTLPQRFIVQAIGFGSTTRVTPIPLDKANHGTFSTLKFDKDVSRIVITVSGNTPITWETASYSFKAQ